MHRVLRDPIQVIGAGKDQDHKNLIRLGPPAQIILPPPQRETQLKENYF